MGMELHPHININGSYVCDPKTLEVKAGFIAFKVSLSYERPCFFLKKKNSNKPGSGGGAHL